MSYEGYTEALCENGHLHELDCMSYPRDYATGEPYPFKCDAVMPDGSTCLSTKIVFEHEVDQTNDEGVPFPFKRLSELLPINRCPACQKAEKIADEVFAIPSEEEKRFFESQQAS